MDAKTEFFISFFLTFTQNPLENSLRGYRLSAPQYWIFSCASIALRRNVDTEPFPTPQRVNFGVIYRLISPPLPAFPLLALFFKNGQESERSYCRFFRHFVPHCSSGRNCRQPCASHAAAHTTLSCKICSSLPLLTTKFRPELGGWRRAVRGSCYGTLRSLPALTATQLRHNTAKIINRVVVQVGQPFHEALFLFCQVDAV